jgi:hypothetical protein
MRSHGCGRAPTRACRARALIHVIAWSGAIKSASGGRPVGEADQASREADQATRAQLRQSDGTAADLLGAPVAKVRFVLGASRARCRYWRRATGVRRLSCSRTAARRVRRAVRDITGELRCSARQRAETLPIRFVAVAINVPDAQMAPTHRAEAISCRSRAPFRSRRALPRPCSRPRSRPHGRRTCCACWSACSTTCRCCWRSASWAARHRRAPLRGRCSPR